MQKHKLTLDQRQSRSFDATVSKYARLMGIHTDIGIADLIGITQSAYSRRKKTKRGWEFWQLCQLFSKLQIPADEIGNIFLGIMK